MLKADGLDDAIIGVGHRCGEPAVVVYDIDLAIQAVQRELKCEIWEAVEYSTLIFWVLTSGNTRRYL